MTIHEAVAAYNAAQAEVKRLWNLMCSADGVNPASKFVVFANSNPYAVPYNEAMTTFQKIRKQIKKNEARRLRHAIPKWVSSGSREPSAVRTTSKPMQIEAQCDRRTSPAFTALVADSLLIYYLIMAQRAQQPKPQAKKAAA